MIDLEFIRKEMITDYSGGENFLHGREVIASNKLIHEELMTRIIN